MGQILDELKLCFFFGSSISTSTQLGNLQSLFSHPGANLGPHPGSVQCVGKSSS